jgi:Class II flagellar assembly regulator
MRINDLRGPQRLSGKQLRKTGDSGEAFAGHLESGTEAGEATGLSGINAVGNSLLLQEVDAADEREQARAHGKRLLDQLNHLQLDLLMGEVNSGQLLRLQQTLERETPAVIPPEMQDTLREIELRVRVELAKFMG